MEKKVKNKLNNVNISGNYVGGDSVVIHHYSSEEKEETEKGNVIRDRTVFLSYSSHDEEIADKIDYYLSSLPNITVKRYSRDIGVWKSIREFMKSIRQQDYGVFIMSDFFLKSPNCMFEVLEMMKEQMYQDKIFPAVVERGIYNALVRVEYIKYWQKECKKLENALKGVEITNAVELVADLKRYKSIASSIGEFLNLVADINNPDIEEVEIQIEKAIQKNK